MSRTETLFARTLFAVYLLYMCCTCTVVCPDYRRENAKSSSNLSGNLFSRGHRVHSLCDNDEGDCKSKGAGKWGWRDGKLTQVLGYVGTGVVHCTVAGHTSGW